MPKLQRSQIMSSVSGEPDLMVELDRHVATVEIHRPPNNFFDYDLIHEIANAYERLDADPECRAIVLCSEGRHFCAGADFSAREKWSQERLDGQASRLYVEAVRVFSCTKDPDRN